MSAFTFGQSDVVVTMTPERPRPGLKPMSRRIYVRFGKARERTVQELCGAIGGECVYLEFKAGKTVHTLPIPSWNRYEDLGSGGSGGRLANVANIIQNVLADGIAPVAYGSDRVRWILSFTNIKQSAARDVMDAEPDSQGSPSLPVPQAPGAMREEF